MPRFRVLLSLLVGACSAPQPTRPAAPPPSPLLAPTVAPVVPTTPQLFADGDPGFEFTDPNRHDKLSAAFPAIDKALEEIKQGLPGFAVGIVIDGELAYSKGFGVTTLGGTTKPDADTVYRIGSISKSFIGLTLLGLRDDGVLAIDDPLVKWIPEASGLVYPTRDARPITLRQLLSHTSGLPRDGSYGLEAGPTEADIVKSLDKLAVETTPGTAHLYSNLGFSLLGLAAAHASRAPLHDVVAKRIFVPLQMTSTFWEAEQVPNGRLATAYGVEPSGLVLKSPARLGAGAGAGGIYSTVRDMARYVAFQMAAYPPRDADDPGPLRRATVREAHLSGLITGMKGTTVPGKGEPQVNTTTYGFGWVREQSCEREVVWHNGAIDASRAEIRFFPSAGVGIVFLSNFPQPNGVMQRILEALLETGGFTSRTRARSTKHDAVVKEFLGVYNHWSEATYKAMLDPKREELTALEKDELAGYKAIHGTCKSISAITTNAPSDLIYALDCERGKFEMNLTFAPGGKIIGFAGTSREVVAPPALAKAVTATLSLTRKWDDAIYKKHLTKIAPIDILKKIATDLRTQHGTCKLGPAKHTMMDWSFEVLCERGTFIFDAALSKDSADQLEKALLHPPFDNKPCPVR